MTPHRDKGLGSFLIDRTFADVGRLKLSSGTSRERTFNRLNAMLSELYAAGRLDQLRRLRDRKVTPLALLDLYRSHGSDPEQLPRESELAPLFPLDGEDSGQAGHWLLSVRNPKTRQGYRKSLAALQRIHTDATASALPDLLRQYRAACQGTHHRSFNLARSAVQSFLRATMAKGRRNPLWVDVAALLPLPEEKRTKRSPLAVIRARELRAKLNARTAGYGDMLWAMCLTGMGPDEYWGAWSVERPAVHIAGTKTGGRDRRVPFLEALASPVARYPAFRKALLLVSTGLDAQQPGGGRGRKAAVRTRDLLKLASQHPDRVTVYDLRRTFANWLETAEIPRTRRRIYRGHEARDIGDLYEWQEVRAFLVEDAGRLRQVIGGSDGPALKLERAESGE